MFSGNKLVTNFVKTFTLTKISSQYLNMYIITLKVFGDYWKVSIGVLWSFLGVRWCSEVKRHTPRSTDYKMGLKRFQEVNFKYFTSIICLQMIGHYFLCMWLYNFFVKMLVINYISTRSLKNIMFSLHRPFMTINITQLY